MPKKQKIKRLVLEFFDDERDRQSVEWLAKQTNTSEYLRQLVAADIERQTQPKPSGPDLTELRRRIERLESALMAKQIPSGYEMAEQIVKMKPPPSNFGTKPITNPKTNGKGDGSAASNLLASLNAFG